MARTRPGNLRGRVNFPQSPSNIGCVVSPVEHWSGVAERSEPQFSEWSESRRFPTGLTERALKCDFPERFAQQALGHNSKAVDHAYSKNAEIIVPSLDDWEKEWGENLHRSVQPKLLPVDFRTVLTAIVESNLNAIRV